MITHPPVPVLACIPVLRTAEVIAMQHHRKRKYARATLGAADVIPIDRSGGGSYKAAKDAVMIRCSRLRLHAWQVTECLGRVASEIRKGRSAGAAVKAGRELAELHAKDNARWGGGAA